MTVTDHEEADRRYIEAMWAFALEENGDYARAAGVARAVLGEDPTGVCVVYIYIPILDMIAALFFRGRQTPPRPFPSLLSYCPISQNPIPCVDLTALHALAHTFEMVSAKREGEAVYKQFAGQWEGLPHSLFTNHVAWHRAIFDLYIDGEGGAQRALEIYDQFLVKDGGKTGPATPLAMADAASLLWRLALRGIDPGAERWAALRGFYAQGGYERAHVSSFNDVHMLLCLAVADPPAARQALGSMRARARGRVGRWLHRTWRRVVLKGQVLGPAEPTNVRVLDEVGIAVGEAVLAFAEGEYGRAVSLLQRTRPRWVLIGGSHAQRDVLMLTLIEACVREETDLPLARRLLAERASVKDPRNEEGTWDRLWEVETRMIEIVAAGRGVSEEGGAAQQEEL
jgi:hypothetical protein